MALPEKKNKINSGSKQRSNKGRNIGIQTWNYLRRKNISNSGSKKEVIIGAILEAKLGIPKEENKEFIQVANQEAIMEAILEETKDTIIKSILEAKEDAKMEAKLYATSSFIFESKLDVTRDVIMES